MKNFLRRNLAIGLIILFVGASAISSVSADIKNSDNLMVTTTPSTTGIFWEDDFDDYDLGQFLDGTPDDGGWKGWDDAPAAGAYVVDNESLSSPHSVEVVGATDLVHEYSGATTGNWTYIAWQYVPEDFEGLSYFILLSDYTDGAGQNNKWAVQIRFDSDSQIVESEFDYVDLPLITGEWVELRVEIDLDNDWFTFYYDDEELISKAWTAGPNNQGDGFLVIDAVDLFANGATPVYYDDMSLEGEATPQPELEIESIAGGFGVTAVIKNNGDGDATNVDWSITLDGGLIILGKETSDTISSIPAGESAEVKSSLILGIGKTTITVAADCDEGSPADDSASGTVILFFVIGVS